MDNPQLNMNNNNNNNNNAEGAALLRQQGLPQPRLLNPRWTTFSTNRILGYGVLSLGLCLAVLSNAWHQNPHFFSMGIYLSRSGASMMALMNVILFFSFIFAKMLQKTVFGPLRRVEVDHLYERTWLTITEMLLAMTIFRDEFDAKLTIFFALLLFLKGFHWISSDRVDYMEHVTNTTFRTYLRLQSFMIFLLAIDLYLVWYTSMHIIKHGKSVMILFGFEFTMLVFSMVVILIKYGINLYDGRREHAWENKTMWVFYLELVHDFLKLTSYLAFFSVIMHFYGLPLHIIRDLYLTLRSFVLKVKDLIAYRRATSNMDTRYPDVMSEELSRISDRTCIICREDMVGKDEQPNLPRRHFPKKLPCQHIFHFGCLRTWLERQQSCPTCRRPVLDAPTVTQQENAPQAAAAAAAAEPPPVPPATSAPAPPPPTAETTPLLGSNVAAPSSSSSSSTTTTASRATLLPSTLSQTTATFTAKTTTSSIPPPSIPASMDALLQASLSTWLSQLPPPPPPPMMLAFTPEQLQTLSESHLTHANLEEKLRLLSLVHAHVSAAMQSLSQLLATLPSPPPPPPPPSSSAPPPSLFPVSSSSTDGN